MERSTGHRTLVRIQGKMCDDTKSLVIVPRRSAKSAQISFRRVCAFKLHKVGPKQFDSRFCLRGFRQRAGTYDPARVSTPVCRRDSDRLTMAWGAGRSDVQSQVGDADRAFLQAPLTTHESDMWMEPPPEWGLPASIVPQVANSEPISSSAVQDCCLADQATTHPLNLIVP